MTGDRQRQAGIALILVIWVVTLLLVIAASFLYATRTDAKAMRNAADIARAEAVARAAVARASIELAKPSRTPGGWRRSPAPRTWSFDGLDVTVTLVDESGRIDINAANQALLLSLLRRVGLDDTESARLLDTILDWRDADSLRRPNGAEESDYVAAGLAARPANQPFQSVEELQLVLGMRADIYQRLAGMITVFSRQPGVNPHFATREVLLTIPGLAEEAVDEYLPLRDAAHRENQPLPPFHAAAAFATYAMSSAVTVRAEVSLPGAMTVIREAVVVYTPQVVRRPFSQLAWREIARRPQAEEPPGERVVTKEAPRGN